MKSTLLKTALVALLLNGGAVLAADSAPDAGKAATSMEGMHHHMMGHDGDEDGKSRRCMHHGMMGGMMPHMIALPALPPGNAKLEMQMQAEAMQKVGEIIAKYAEQVKEPVPAAKP